VVSADALQAVFIRLLRIIARRNRTERSAGIKNTSTSEKD